MTTIEQKLAKRQTLARRIAEYAFEEEVTAMFDKIDAYRESLVKMADAEFAQAVREDTERLIKDVEGARNG
jgi:vacuolar-type H+-ATPase subunit E/Vma4